jgi:hypothetical protein
MVVMDRTPYSLYPIPYTLHTIPHTLYKRVLLISIVTRSTIARMCDCCSTESVTIIVIAEVRTIQPLWKGF